MVTAGFAFTNCQGFQSGAIPTVAATDSSNTDGHREPGDLQTPTPTPEPDSSPTPSPTASPTPVPSPTPTPYPEKPFADGVVAEQVVAGFGFTEGPAWSPQLGKLFFVDQNAKSILRLDGASSSTYVAASKRANGMAFDKDGSLIACETDTTRVVRYPYDPVTKTHGNPVVLADKWDNKSFSSPNDVVIGKDGSLYFTDPTWGTSKFGFNGIYRIRPDGVLELMSSKIARPNGITISPDFKRIYVDDEPSSAVWVFELKADGTFVNDTGKKFFSIPASTGGAEADGMTADQAGNVYVTSHNRVFVIAPSANDPDIGTSVQMIEFPKTPGIATTNVGFGGSDWKTLYITNGNSVHKIQSQIPGVEALLFK